MKNVTGPMMGHLGQVVTSLATCWRIIRTDGVTFAFTSLDTDLVVSGISYSATAGFSQSAISSGSTGAVDNVEIIGFFSDDGIVEDDVKKGLFDYAQVFLFAVNWQDLTMGQIALRTGTLGECSRSQSGTFLAELRGLTQALVQEFGNFLSPLCRADLGDGKCRIPIMPPAWIPNNTVQIGQYCQALTQSNDALRVAIFRADPPGTTGSTEPIWDSTLGASLTDGTVTWTSVPYYRGLTSVTSVTSQNTFVTPPLTIPGALQAATNTGYINVTNNVSAGTDLQISDGINTSDFHTDYDMRGSGDSGGLDALHEILISITEAGLNMTATYDGTVITLVNHSGLQGTITKDGDYLGALVIQNFGTVVLDAGTVTWLTGANAGLSMEMKTYTSGTLEDGTPIGTVSLWLRMAYPIAPGDRFFYYPGCDKTRQTCFLVYNNIHNFRGEPDMRGMDVQLSYPDV